MLDVREIPRLSDVLLVLAEVPWSDVVMSSSSARGRKMQIRGRSWEGHRGDRAQEGGTGENRRFGHHHPAL